MAIWNSGAVLKMSAWLGPWLCFDEGGLAKQSRVSVKKQLLLSYRIPESTISL